MEKVTDYLKFALLSQVPIAKENFEKQAKVIDYLQERELDSYFREI